MAVKELEIITHTIRGLVLSRWTQNDIMDHVSVKLPAPIFDHLLMEMKADIPLTTAPDLTKVNDHFTFGGIKFERVHGRYWSIPDDLRAQS